MQRPEDWYPNIPLWVWSAKEKIIQAGLDEAEARPGARHVTAMRFMDYVVIDYAPPETPLDSDWGEMVYDLGNQLEMLWSQDERASFSPQPLAAINPQPDRAEAVVMARHIYTCHLRVSASIPAGGSWESIRDHIIEKPNILRWCWG